MRLIDADALNIRKFQERECNGFGEGAAYRQGWNDAIDAIMENEVTIEPEPQWISCSERLPNERKEVLITLEFGVDIGEYRDGSWHSEWIYHYDDDNVFAWMPLPTPYKGGDDE